MVYLSQLLRKDNFLTIEAIEEIINDKCDEFNYIFFKNPFWGFNKNTQKRKEKRTAVDWGKMATNMTGKNP